MATIAVHSPPSDGAGPGRSRTMADKVFQNFINGADTRTKGVDLVGNYSQDLGEYGSLKWTAALRDSQRSSV